MSDAPYPNASVMIDPKEYIVFGIVKMGWDHARMGQMLADMSRDLVAGRFEDVERLPFVVRTYKGTCVRPSIPPTVKAGVLASGPCVACGSEDELEVDHIIPWSRGGTHDRDNLQVLCMPCNREKRDRTMEEWMEAREV